MFLFVGHGRGRKSGKCSNVNLVPTRVSQGSQKCATLSNLCVYQPARAVKEFPSLLFQCLFNLNPCFLKMFKLKLNKTAHYIKSMLSTEVHRPCLCFLFISIHHSHQLWVYLLSLHHNLLKHFHREKLLVKPMKRCTSGTKLYLPTKLLN